MQRGQPKPAHYRGRYHVQARQVREAAKANPFTPCWRCGLTLAQHPRHKTGRPPFWTAGHIITGDPRSDLAPEVSVCNIGHGASIGGRIIAARKRERRTALTW